MNREILLHRERAFAADWMSEGCLIRNETVDVAALDAFSERPSTASKASSRRL